MKKIGAKGKSSRAGYLQALTLYQAKGYIGCPLRKQCHQQRRPDITVNNNPKRLKQHVEKRLKTKRGIQKRKQRCFDTEPVFAQIKHNHQFRRFLHRGIDKVTVEIGLLALAHNLRKKTASKA